MSKLLLPAALLLALAGCQSATAPTTAADAAPADAAAAPATTAPVTAAGAPTSEAAARAAVSRFVQTLPNATLYVPDSASVVDVDTHWQVLVPRTDWAKRMPNKAAFEVDKATGTVTTRPVK